MTQSIQERTSETLDRAMETMQAAGEEIDRLRQQNAELRGALERVICRYGMADVWIAIQHARAVLARTEAQP